MASTRTIISMLALLALSGCCGQGVGDVSGNVTFKGKPLPAGTVTIFGTNGRVAVGQIDDDGSYEVHKAPAGPVTITVDSHPPPIIYRHGPNGRPVPLEGQPPPGKYFRIPERYARSHESGLSTDINRGENTYDIKLGEK